MVTQRQLAVPSFHARTGTHEPTRPLPTTALRFLPPAGRLGAPPRLRPPRLRPGTQRPPPLGPAAFAQPRGSLAPALLPAHARRLVTLVAGVHLLRGAYSTGVIDGSPR